MNRVRVSLTQNALTVLERRYLLKDTSGKIIETPEQMFWRTAKAVSFAENRERSKWADKFYEMMAELRFVPNSPTLMNAGRSKGQLSACFVLPVGDSLESIFDSLKWAAMIHQSGGGTGFSFSHLRQKGSRVRDAAGVASGPVSFIKVFDVTTETIKQGGARRGANMAVLRVDHPDIGEFIDVKRDQKSITNFNLSVGITDEFMHALRDDREFFLRAPETGDPVCRVRAKQLFARIAHAAWECGDPGLIFLDRVNLFNPTPGEGIMESTNPCGEQPLLPFESCNLGSLNVAAFFKSGAFDWSGFGEAVQVATRFLDNVIDVNNYPILECEKITLKNRKIGLGVMGFADLLLLMGLPYDSPEAREVGERIMSFLDREAKIYSAQLAILRGPFPNWKTSFWRRLGYPPLRNATVSTVAPTGTISMIAGVSSGIEPVFSGVFYRNILSGERLIEILPVVERILSERGIDHSHVNEQTIKEYFGPVWTPAAAVSVENHVKMQAVFQRHTDSAVSKTINLPESATPGDIETAYRLAYDLGCKGITAYRDRSRAAQVLEHVQEEIPEEKGLCSSC